MPTIWVHILWYLTQLLVNATNNNIRRRRAIRVAENQHRWQVIRRRQQLRRRQQHRLITVCRLRERRQCHVLFGHLLLINVTHYMIFFDNKPDTTNLITTIGIDAGNNVWRTGRLSCAVHRMLQIAPWLFTL